MTINTRPEGSHDDLAVTAAARCSGTAPDPVLRRRSRRLDQPLGYGARRVRRVRGPERHAVGRRRLGSDGSSLGCRGRSVGRAVGSCAASIRTPLQRPDRERAVDVRASRTGSRSPAHGLLSRRGLSDAGQSAASFDFVFIQDRSNPSRQFPGGGFSEEHGSRLSTDTDLLGVEC